MKGPFLLYLLAHLVHCPPQVVEVQHDDGVPHEREGAFERVRLSLLDTHHHHHHQKILLIIISCLNKDTFYKSLSHSVCIRVSCVVFYIQNSELSAQYHTVRYRHLLI